MENLQQQLQTYYQWLKSRGQIWPLYGPEKMPPPQDQTESSPRARVLFLTDWLELTAEEAELLQKMTKAMGIETDDFCLKHLPNAPQDQKNLRINQGTDYVESIRVTILEEIKNFEPNLIICLGEIPTKILPDSGQDSAALKKQPFDITGIFIIPTFHPRDLLRFQNNKKYCWQDLQKAMAKFSFHSKNQ